MAGPMDKTVAISIPFALVGAAFIVGAVTSAFNTLSFLGAAERATGEVISLEETRSSRDSPLFRPVFRFKTSRGREIVFRSPSSSSPPAYDQGERVEIAYLASAPERARVISISSLWLSSLLLGMFGTIFSGIGGGTLLVRRVRAVQHARLKREGQPIETDFQNVQVNTQLAVNGAYPWRIVTQWKNPATGELHLFHSENIWFDPSAHISSKRITVYLDPANQKKYYVDISFLPKLAR